MTKSPQPSEEWKRLNSIRSLIDWLLEKGEVVERKRLAGESLSEAEALLREVWIFDMELQNGGISQYFCNQDIRQWQDLRNLAAKHPLPEFLAFLENVQRVIDGSPDPYVSVLEHDDRLSRSYDALDAKLYEHLQRLVGA